MPKSSMTRQNWIGLVWCFPSASVSLLCVYPFFASLCSRSSCASNPTCGKPYIPFLISMYIPHQLLFSLTCLTSSGMSFNLIWRYSYCLSGVLRYEILMSIVINLALNVDMTLLRSNFMVSMSAVGMSQYYVLLILSPPTVCLVWFGSAFPSI